MSQVIIIHFWIYSPSSVKLVKMLAYRDIPIFTPPLRCMNTQPDASSVSFFRTQALNTPRHTSQTPMSRRSPGTKTHRLFHCAVSQDPAESRTHLGFFVTRPSPAFYYIHLQLAMNQIHYTHRCTCKHERTKKTASHYTCRCIQAL